MRTIRHLLAMLLFATIAASGQERLTCPNWGMHSVKLTWTASPSTGVTSYNIYKSSSSGVYGTRLASVSSSVTNFTESGLGPYVTSYYTVTAVCATCSPSESAKSNEVKTVTPCIRGVLVDGGTFKP